MRAAIKRAGRRILVVDDDTTFGESLAEAMHAHGYRTSQARSGERALEQLASNHVDVVLLDYRLPDVEGTDLLDGILELRPGLPVILLTAFGSSDLAVEAIKLGAHDYLTKPCKLEQVIIRVERALEASDMRDRLERYRYSERRQRGAASVVGESAAMERLRCEIARVAQSAGATTILIQGESGTGKNLVARAIHAESERSDRPFVTVTCTAIPDTLLESELFGHEKGAFTGATARKRGLVEQAAGGSLLLDEIGDMPLSLQAKLLHFLETRTFRRLGGLEDICVDVHILAATHYDVEQAAAEARFRTDLLYRLNVITLEIPPLRERPDDIRALATLYARELGEQLAGVPRKLADPALRKLTSHHWPGNVRELRNVIERAVILGGDEVIRPRDLPIGLRHSTGRAPVESVVRLPPEGIDLDAIERQLLELAMERTGGNQSAAARLLGISRDRLRYRLRRDRKVGRGQAAP